MTQLLRNIGRLAAGSLIAVLASACSSSSDETGSAPPSPWWYGTSGASGVGGGGGGGATAGGGGTAPADAALTFNPLCGVRTCDPGYRKACNQPPAPTPSPGSDAPASPADAAIDTGMSVEGSSAVDATDATDDGAVDATDATDTGAVDASGVPARDASIDASNDPTDAAPDLDAVAELAKEASDGDAPAPIAALDGSIADAQPPAFGCYIEKIGAELVPTCAPAGNRTELSACDDSHECEPGLGCVDMGFVLECASSLACPDAARTSRGECRQLYCSLPVTCPASTFYLELPLRVLGETSRYKVPVCMQIDGCDMLSWTSCSGGRVCTIVGDNATTCLLPGTAQRDESCDDRQRCAQGLVCSKSNNKCMKLCRTDFHDSDCPGGTCEGGSAAFPKGLGVCLGDVPDAGSGD
jgi:hypothetical protein